MRLMRLGYLNLRQCLGAFLCASLIVFGATAFGASASAANPQASGTSAPTKFQTDWPFVHTSHGPHEVRVLNDGLVAFEQRLKLIENAKSSIDVMTYIFSPDESSALILHSLMKKALEGVRVRVLVDWFTDTGKAEISDYIATSIRRELRKKAGPAGLKGSFEIRYYNRGSLVGSLLRINHRNHAKVMIADKTEFIAGGRNIGDNYFALERGDHDYLDRDLWIRSRSLVPKESAALQASAAFEAYWNDKDWVSRAKRGDDGSVTTLAEQKMAALDENGDIPERELREQVSRVTLNARLKTHVVNSVTFAIDKVGHKKSDRVVTPVINKMLKAAERYLILENYALPMSDAKLALMKSVAKRKVPVLVLTNSFETHDNNELSGYSQPQEAALLKSAPNVWLWALRGELSVTGLRIAAREHSGVVSTHSKTIVSYTKTQALAGVGSYNFDVRSEKTNNEALVIVDDHNVANEITQDITSRMALGHPIVVGHKNRLYYSDTQEYQKRKFSDLHQVLNAIGLGKLVRSLY